jgi:GxxExxY protein
MELNEITGEIIDSSMKIHRVLGPGLLEVVYQRCLAYELDKKGLRFQEEVPFPLVYEEVRLQCGFRADMVVEGKVIVELKSVEILNDVHMAQVLTYLRLSGCKLGLLINFNVKQLKHGLRRFIM